MDSVRWFGWTKQASEFSLEKQKVSKNCVDALKCFIFLCTVFQILKLKRSQKLVFVSTKIFELNPRLLGAEPVKRRVAEKLHCGGRRNVR